MFVRIYYLVMIVQLVEVELGVCLFYDKSVVCTSVLLPDKHDHLESL